jgi:hypothetical protein
MNCKPGRHENQWTVKHRMTRSPEYRSWQGMRDRCFNLRCKDYHKYGGRGITVCSEWADSFERFHADMGGRPDGTSIERRDNSGPYCKDNCYWATPTEQTRNRRNARNVTHGGATMPLIELCRQYGADYSTVHSRIFKHGWPIEQALTAPKHARRSSL